MSTLFCKEAINFLLDLVQTSYTKLNGSTSFIRNVTNRTFSRPQKESSWRGMASSNEYSNVNTNENRSEFSIRRRSGENQRNSTSSPDIPGGRENNGPSVHHC